MTYSIVAKRLRLPLGFLLAAGYLAFARPTVVSLSAGALIALIGILLRGWASGYIVKNERLAVAGPYAHTRNPLYLGSFLIASGFALAASWWLLVVVVSFFVLVYAPTIARERVNIQSRFPEAYPAYEANVPAFVPRVTPWSDSAPVNAGTDDQFRLSLYMKHGEWKAALGYSLAVLWLVIRIWLQF